MKKNIKDEINKILDLLDGKDLNDDEVKVEAIKSLVDIVYGTKLFTYKAQVLMELIKVIDKEGSDIIRDVLSLLEKTKKPIYPEDIRKLQYTMMPPEYWLGDE